MKNAKSAKTVDKPKQVKVGKADLLRQAASFYGQKKFAEAAAIYRLILEHETGDAAVWSNLGSVLRQLGKLEASRLCSLRALEINPNDAGTLTNYGNCLVDLDLKDEALKMHASAVKLRPDNFLTCRNYALALRDLGQHEEALEYFNRAIAMRPDDQTLLWDRAMTYLYLGRYKEGWEDFEARWKQPGMKPRQYRQPQWRGEDIKGKTVLVYEEQGFGDSILCSRYIPLIAERGAKIILECKKPLHRLFSTLPGVQEIAEPGKAGQAFDYHVPMMSLPGIFKTDLTNIPPPARLFTDAQLSPQVEHLLKRGEGRLKVGIVWSGSVTFGSNAKRAVGVERFLPLAAVPGVLLYSLQKGPPEKELQENGLSGVIPELGPHLNDFAETAAALKRLDLVIMTDSAVAHLAGSLGVPVWNMLGSRAYWLYLTEREDTPWYASMKLLRQKIIGDWDILTKNVENVLREYTHELSTNT